MVMTELIEPGLKPDLSLSPPRGYIFVLYCSHCLHRSACIEGGRGPTLSTSLTSHSRDLI